MSAGDRDRDTADRETRLDSVVADYLDELDSGRAVDPRQWLSRFPEFYDELSDFFADRDEFEQLASGLRDLSRSADVELSLDWLGPPAHPEHLGSLAAYEVLEWVGRGGMGVVFKAFDASLNRFVAIKVLAPQWSADSSARRRFTREAQAAAAISHPHVITIHAVGEWHGRPYLVMEFVTGSSLQQRIDESGPLELKEILRIGIQAALGLAAAHAQGLIHRDVKPANIMLENELARVKLTDFGLARAVDDTLLTQHGTLAGTPQYMAPEQARGEPLDRRADLFSLGSVLFAMCTGRAAFRGSSTIEVIRRVCEDRPPPIRELNPDVPAWLCEIVERLHDKTPSERFQSAAEIAELLGRHLARLQDPSLPPVRHGWVRRAAMREQLARLGASASSRWLAVPTLLLLGALGWGVLSQLASPLPKSDVATAPPGPGSPGSGASGKADDANVAAEPPPKAEPTFADKPLVTRALIDPSRLAQEYRHDFRNDAYDVRAFRVEGGTMSSLVRPDPRGLRIALPKGMTQNLAVCTKFGLHGDFEVTATYEVLAAERPLTGSGVGAELYLRSVDGWSNYVAMSRTLRPGDGPAFVSGAQGTMSDGKRHYLGSGVEADLKRGRFRIVRVGPTVHYLAAEDGSDAFREIHRTEYGTKDFDMVRLAAIMGRSGRPVDVLWKDVVIRAEALPGWVGDAKKPARFLSWIAAGGVLGTLALAAGLWRRGTRRRSRKPSAEPEVHGEPVAAGTPADPDGWDEAALSRLEERARAYAQMHPDAESYAEPPQFQFALRDGTLNGPFVAWEHVDNATLKRLGTSWGEVRERLPRRFEGGYRDGRRNGAFRFRDRSGAVRVRRFRDGESID